tara:strand:+ start:7974 stop:8540 length:567 start_codon:yes stop_codon:yes gene_type:complete
MKKKTLKLTDIKPYPKNPRKISEPAVEVVKRSIEEFGYNSPIVVDKDNVVIMGHTRLKALQALKWDKCSVVVADHLTEVQVKKLRVIDNRIGELASWDDKLLTDELRAVAGSGEMDAYFNKNEVTKLLGALDNVPTGGASPTGESIAEQSASMDTHFSDETHRRAEKLVEIPCPECNEKFFVDRDLAK